MQPWYEAQGLGRDELAGQSVPPLVTQIADGENGGVMMNEFPSKYFEVVREASGSDVPLMNATEYLEHLFARGVRESDLPEIQPLFQDRIWARMQPGDGPDGSSASSTSCGGRIGRFHMEGGSWTNDLSWVRGYENVLGPMEEAERAVPREGHASRRCRPTSAAIAMRCSTCSRRRPAATATGARASGPTTAARSAAAPRRS